MPLDALYNGMKPENKEAALEEVRDVARDIAASFTFHPDLPIPQAPSDDDGDDDSEDVDLEQLDNDAGNDSARASPATP